MPNKLADFANPHHWICAIFAASLIAIPSAAQAHLVLCSMNLSGPNESPSTPSLGIGSGFVTLDFDEVTMRIQMNFSGLTGTTTAAAIHAATAAPRSGTAGIATPVPTLTGFPIGIASGSYDRTFDLALAGSYNPAFITASGGTVSNALNAFTNAVETGRAYFSIKTSAFSQGEIRGFLLVVPEPSSFVFAGLGLLGLFAYQSRKRKFARACSKEE